MLIPAHATRVEFARFVLLRAACAVFSYGLYLVLLLWIRYEAAYVIAFVAGVALAYVVNTLVVFREPMRRHSALRFPVVYVVQFVLSWLLLALAVERFGVPESWALLLAVSVTLPVTFVLSRRIIRGRH